MTDFRRFVAVLVWVGALGTVCGMPVAQASAGAAAGNAALPSLFVVGNGDRGLAPSLERFVDPSKIHVIDRSATAGVRATVESGAWSATLAMIRPGDFVLIEFARSHGPAGDAESLPGVSDDARRFAGKVAPQGNDVVQSYGWYLRRVAVEVIARGATPILCAPVTEDRAEQSRDEEWTRAIAVQQRISFVDAPAAARDVRQASTANGGEQRKGTPAPDTTAKALVAALRGLAENPLAGYFSADGNSIAPFRPPPEATTPPL